MAFIAIFVGFVSAALAQDAPMKTGVGDYKKSSGKYASGFQKYMSSGGQGSSGGKASGNLPEYASHFVPAGAKSYSERPAANGKADSAKQSGQGGDGGSDKAGASDQYMKKYAADYQKYMDYKKYMGQGQGGSAQPTELVSAGDKKESAAAGPAQSDDKYKKQYAASKDQYMKKYAGDYSKYMKQGGATSAKIHNKSDSNEWGDYYKNKYAPHVHNKSDPNEVRDFYKKKYAGDYSHYATQGKATQQAENSKRDTAQLKKVAAEQSAVKAAASKLTTKEQAPAVVAQKASVQQLPKVAVQQSAVKAAASRPTIKEQAPAVVAQKASVQQLPKVAVEHPPVLQKASTQKASAARSNAVASRESLLVKANAASMGLPTLLVGVVAILAMAAVALNVHSRSRQQAQVGPDFYMPLV